MRMEPISIQTGDSATARTSGRTSVYNDGTYLQKHPTWHSEDSAWKANQAMNMLARNKLCSLMRVCEVGCGAGQVLVELQHRLPNYTSFFGYEISRDAYQLCLQKENESLHFNLVEFENVDCEPFDLLLVLDVVEHVPDYLGFLERIRPKARYVLFHMPLELTAHSLMRGVLMLNRRTMGHLHHFTKDTALATLDDSGYSVVDWFYTPAVDLGPRDIKSTISSLVRRLSFKIAPDKSVLLFGGYALMVLAASGRAKS